MTKSDFREELLNSGFTYLYVVSFDDNNGRDVCICVDEPQLGKKDRIEWQGNLTDVLRDRRLIFDSLLLYNNGEEVKIPITLEDLVINYIDD